MFNVHVDLNIYSMALKSPNGELSLEIVIIIVILMGDIEVSTVIRYEMKLFDVTAGFVW